MSSLEQSGTPLDKPQPGAEISDFDRKVYQAMNKAYAQMQLLNPHNEFLVQHLALNQPPISISQIFGFTGFTFQPATTIDTQESTTSTTYVDLTTVGPQLTGIGTGRFAVFFGSETVPTGGTSSYMSVSTNGAAAVDGDSVVAAAAGSSSRLILRTFTADNNSLVAKYRSSTASSTAFLRRWLIVMKYDNA